MFYSELLGTLSKQEKSPVNKMYLSELNLKWKNFQELISDTSSKNEDLVKTLSMYLNALHNRKLLYNKLRGTGFYHNSPLFSAYYIHDLISALLNRHPLLKQPGIEWGFNSFSYEFSITGTNPLAQARFPRMSSLKSPPVLSLVQHLEIQYRLAGKRNFTKSKLVVPYLLFFAFKNPKPEHLFMVEHYATIANRVSRFVKTFVICESISVEQEEIFEDLPVTVFAIKSQDNKKDSNEISVDIVNKLEESISAALTPEVYSNIIKEKQKSAPVKKKQVRKKTGRRTSRLKK